MFQGFCLLVFIGILLRLRSLAVRLSAVERESYDNLRDLRDVWSTLQCWEEFEKETESGTSAVPVLAPRAAVAAPAPEVPALRVVSEDDGDDLDPEPDQWPAEQSEPDESDSDDVEPSDESPASEFDELERVSW